jgi:hypothetical protein
MALSYFKRLIDMCLGDNKITRHFCLYRILQCGGAGVGAGAGAGASFPMGSGSDPNSQWCGSVSGPGSGFVRMFEEAIL